MSVTTGVNMQVAIVLDELPAEVLQEIEDNQESLEIIKAALKKPGVKLSGYFRDITDPGIQVDFTARNLFDYLKRRRERKKLGVVEQIEEAIALLKPATDGSTILLYSQKNKESEIQEALTKAELKVKITSAKPSESKPDTWEYVLRITVK